jgi:hypothetical protein
LLTLRGVPEGTATTEVTVPEAGVEDIQLVPLNCKVLPTLGLAEAIGIPLRFVSA